MLHRLWSGEVPLGEAFWWYAMIVGTALNLATTLLAMALLAMDVAGIAAAIAFALPIPYNLLVLVAVWRSAAGYPGPRIWADLARAGVVIWAALASVL
ncbi:MAG: hypothetical protein ACREH6_13065 [Geminicoccaceae bacterium]